MKPWIFFRNSRYDLWINCWRKIWRNTCMKSLKFFGKIGKGIFAKSQNSCRNSWKIPLVGNNLWRNSEFWEGICIKTLAEVFAEIINRPKVFKKKKWNCSTNSWFWKNTRDEIPNANFSEISLRMLGKTPAKSMKYFFYIYTWFDKILIWISERFLE